MTDAHVVLGNVATGAWSGGVHIRGEPARAALAPIAAALGVTVERAAEALVATADATMARALRRVSVERGVDPRDTVLVAFGGGGPLHACGLAERLGMTRVVVPPHAGVLSAVGLALAPERREGLASLVAPLDSLSAADLAARMHGERDRLRGGAGQTKPALALEPRWWLRSRYQGQGHELDIPLQQGDDGRVVAARFVEAHRARTGFTLERSVECISMRTALLGAPWHAGFARAAPTMDNPLADGEDDGREMDRTIVGPAVVRLPDATLRVGAGWTGRSLPIGGWMLEKT